MRRIAVLLLAFVSLPGCAGVRELAALGRVDFRFDRIADPRVAGIPIAGIRTLEDLTAAHMARLTLAIASGDVPLDLTVHITGTNPETNRTTAKLIGLDWSYLVDERELVKGQLKESYQFPPGRSIDVPLGVTLDLVEFFGSDARILFDTALALAGQRASAHKMVMRLRPVIETSMGPMRYPAPVDIPLTTGR